MVKSSEVWALSKERPQTCYKRAAFALRVAWNGCPLRDRSMSGYSLKKSVQTVVAVCAIPCIGLGIWSRRAI